MTQPAQASPKARRGRRWTLLAAAAVLAGGGVALALWLRPPPQPTAGPLGAELNVLVGPPDRLREPVSITEAGALPVRSGGIMCLDVEYQQPMFTYLVWINSDGRAFPLYPWNSNKLEITDMDQPPPERRGGKLVFSPLLGGRWIFGETVGMETVLLLARTTPLPAGTSVGKLLGNLPIPVSARQADELVILEVKDHAASVASILSRNRGDQEEAKAADEPLRALLLRLSPHFDLVRAVRFPHLEPVESAGRRGLPERGKPANK